MIKHERKKSTHKVKNENYEHLVSDKNSLEDVDTILTVENLSICAEANQLSCYQPIDLPLVSENLMKKSKYLGSDPAGPESHFALIAQETERVIGQTGKC